MLQDIWSRAWQFAAQAHRTQFVPGTQLPYLVHLGSVSMEILVAHHERSFAQPDLAVQCSLLHDTLEDTEVKLTELESHFGAAVAAGVQALTKDPELKGREAMADSLRRIRNQPVEVWAVKLADRISNLAPPPVHWTSDRVAGYRAESEMILSALRDAHGPLASRLTQRIAAYPPAR